MGRPRGTRSSVSGCQLVRRAPLALAVFLVLVAAACSAGGEEAKPLSTQAPKAPADAFVAEMLDGRPDDAAERLSSSHAGFAFDLPQISINLQECVPRGGIEAAQRLGVRLPAARPPKRKTGERPLGGRHGEGHRLVASRKLQPG